MSSQNSESQEETETREQHVPGTILTPMSNRSVEAKSEPKTLRRLEIPERIRVDVSKSPLSPLSQQADDFYDTLLTRNKEWCEKVTDEDPEYFQRLAQGQKPLFMMIGCSDSRVPPDQMLKTQPGAIFIHRNVANQVVSTDMNAMSVLQYAVEVLKVRRVIVMGHYGCGGIKAAMEKKSHGLIDKWLRNIKDVYRLHKDELNAIKDKEARFRRLTELHVVEQCVNLEKSNIIQKAVASGHPVSVHGWVFDIATGLVRDLKVEEMTVWSEIQDIYDLNLSDVSDDEDVVMHGHTHVEGRPPHQHEPDLEEEKLQEVAAQELGEDLSATVLAQDTATQGRRKRGDKCCIF